MYLVLNTPLTVEIFCNNSFFVYNFKYPTQRDNHNLFPTEQFLENSMQVPFFQFSLVAKIWDGDEVSITKESEKSNRFEMLKDLHKFEVFIA